MAAKVSLQLLSQTVTNYSPFRSGEEHAILQILNQNAPGKPREVWPLRGLQDGSEDLAKGPVSFALASSPAARPTMLLQAEILSVSHQKAVSNVRTPHGPARETFPAVLSTSHKGHLSLALGCSPPRCLRRTQERWHFAGLALHFQGERLMLFSYQLLYYTTSEVVVFVLLPRGI